jgi:2-oxoglutarate dehydrogenase E2 component (dihydrolipoamide succinyltransferase)
MPSGSNGKIIKQDVLEALSNPGRKPGTEMFSRTDRPEKMSNLRKTISRRLVEAKNTTAMLTTFNEVDMGPIMEIRKKHKDKFKELHGVNLGFMSFFSNRDLVEFFIYSCFKCVTDPPWVVRYTLQKYTYENIQQA